MTDKHEIAEYLVQAILEEGTVYQETIVYELQGEFGDEWVYHNENGNLAISTAVTAQFRKIKPDNIE